MSLINQMLNDLESRQAFLDEKSDSVLDGLQHTDVYEYEEDHSRPLLLFMVLSIMLISLLVYAVSSLGNFNIGDAGKLLSGVTGRIGNPGSEILASQGPSTEVSLL